MSDRFGEVDHDGLGSEVPREWTYDPASDRPLVDQDCLKRAQAIMVRDEGPMQKYLRQQWDVAQAGARVTIDALRRMYPTEAEYLQQINATYEIEAALVHATKLCEHLALVSAEMLGDVMHRAEMGRLTRTELDELEKESTDG